MPKISLVVPAHNEEQYLPRLLDSVLVACQRYRAGAAEVEVVVADNASIDRTSAIALERGCSVVPVEKRSIAAARNAGAGAASGEILAFVDADCQIHPNTFNALDDSLALDHFIVGATGVRMDRMSLGIAVSWYLVVVPLLFLSRSDTGVVFCRRSDWESVGGYDESRLWAEDVDFLFALKRLGRTRGKRFVRVRGARAITSARKFDRHGDWHYFVTLFRGFGWMLFNRSGFSRFARGYWYER